MKLLTHILRLVLVMELLSTGLFQANAEIAQKGVIGPQLILDGGIEATVGVPIFVPLTFTGGGHEITAIAFSLDLDLDALQLDSADDNGDGIPDAVSFPFGAAGFTIVSFDATDQDAELDILLAELSGLPFSDGLLLEIEVVPTGVGQVADWIRFSRNPAPSFGNAQGQDVPGSATVTGSGLIFADGFESGDLSRWQKSDP